MTFLHKFRLILVSVLFLAGCSQFATKPINPTIKLVSIAPLNISVPEQQLRFELLVTNPNHFALPVKSINFIARFNESDVASGQSIQTTVIPANGNAILTLDVTAEIDRLMTTLQTLLHRQTLNLNYELAGYVEIQHWTAAIPFNVSGALDFNKASKVKNSQ